LAFAIVVAEDVNGVILAKPAMKLGKEFAPLRLGDLRFGRAFTERAESIEAGKKCGGAG